MSSFMACARKKVTDIKAFVKEASGANGLKYKAERNAKHLLYIPVKMEEADGKEIATINAQMAKVHEGNDANQKYYSFMCLDGIYREDTQGDQTVVLNDGTCPYCEAVQDAWEIYNLRMELAKAQGKTEKELEEAKKIALDERKVKEANDYMYLVVCQIKLKTGTEPEINATTGLPEYELKVMRMSKSKAEKLMNGAEDSGLEFAGSELIYNYPDTEDPRLLSGQATSSFLVPGTKKSVISQYPELKKAMDEACEKFEWDSIAKVFPEWKGTTTKEAKIFVETQFKQFNQYKLELQSNPNAQYLEYVAAPATNKPELGNSANADTDPNAVFGNEENAKLEI